MIDYNRAMSDAYQTITFGAGCFWGVEDVCSHTTGHAEVLQLKYDPREISFEKLLETFWSCHNPTTKNRQGELRRVSHQADVTPDVGSQYRSAIFFHTPQQETAAKKAIEALGKSGKYDRPIVTEVTPAEVFYRAEEYHQKYFQKHGMASCHNAMYPVSR